MTNNNNIINLITIFKNNLNAININIAIVNLSNNIDIFNKNIKELIYLFIKLYFNINVIFKNQNTILLILNDIMNNMKLSLNKYIKLIGTKNYFNSKNIIYYKILHFNKIIIRNIKNTLDKNYGIYLLADITNSFNIIWNNCNDIILYLNIYNINLNISVISCSDFSDEKFNFISNFYYQKISKIIDKNNLSNNSPTENNKILSNIHKILSNKSKSKSKSKSNLSNSSPIEKSLIKNNLPTNAKKQNILKYLFNLINYFLLKIIKIIKNYIGH